MNVRRVFLTKSEVRADAREKYPSEGDRIEFQNDRFTDKGPSSGVVTQTKITVDGLYVKIKHSDEERLFSWDDLQPYASKSGNRWLIKAIVIEHHRRSHEPTEQQLKAGNYQKRKLPWQGLTISIENEAGSIRRGTNRDGTSWEVRMKFPYGYLRGTKGVDGDHVDCFVGPNLDAPTVYVIHARKVNRWDQYDEDKCMIGFDSEEDAKHAFLSCYNDPRFLGPITAMPVDQFAEKARMTMKRPSMIKAIVFLKSLVAGHTRRLADGRVVSVSSYSDRRVKQATHHHDQMALFVRPQHVWSTPRLTEDQARNPERHTRDLFGESHEEVAKRLGVHLHPES